MGIFITLSVKLTQQVIDKGLSVRDISEIEVILKSFNEVKSYNKIRTRQSGSTIFIDMHIQVDKSLSTQKAHEVTKKLEERIKEKFL